MYNDWFTIGGLTIHGYGAMIAIGVLFAFFYAEKAAKKHGLDEKNIDNMIIFILFMGWLCAKVLYCLVEFEQFIKDPMSVLGSSGWVVYGGIFGGIFGAWLYAKKHHYDFKKYCNVLIPAVALAQGFGRIGCFFAGCCHGAPTNAWYGVLFPTDSLCTLGVKVIPTQLISAAGDFVIFYLLHRNLNNGKHPEDTFALYMVLYSIGRFIIEMFRGDPRGTIGFLSTSQFFSIITLVVGAYLIYRRQNKQVS